MYKVFTNEAYCGTLVWGGTRGHPALHSGGFPVRVENAWPGILDRATLELVQRKLAAKSPVVTHPRTVPSYYLLSGFLFCSCGRAMTGHSAKSGRHFYYLCSRSFNQGRDACDARMLPKEKLETLVIDQLRAKVLTDENLEELVTLVNEELGSTKDIINARLETIEAELNDLRMRLSRLYDAIETGKVSLDDLAPRIKELRARQDELSKAALQLEADKITQRVNHVDAEMVKSYAGDLKSLLGESDIAESKAFLRSFIKRIQVNGGQAVVHYNLSVPPHAQAAQTLEVLPMVTLGGGAWTVLRTFSLAFSL